jgi:hypothetical protein
MPTVFHHGSYRFFFYSSDRNEPLHIHVQREDRLAKFWLEPVRLAKSGGFGRAELMDIQRIVADNTAEIMESWHEYFGR